MEDIRYLKIINPDSLFNHCDHDNLENYFKEVYKCDSIYDLFFTETAFICNYPGDD